LWFWTDAVECGGSKKDKVYYDTGIDTVRNNCEKKFLRVIV
jgi:hypothetical protein